MVNDNSTLAETGLQPVITPRLRRLLRLVLLLVVLLVVNSTYLAAITLLEHSTADDVPTSKCPASLTSAPRS